LPVSERHVLKGKVHEKKASDIEEVSAIAISLTGNPFTFRTRLSPQGAMAMAQAHGKAYTPAITPGWEKILFTPPPPPKSDRELRQEARMDYFLTTKYAKYLGLEPEKPEEASAAADSEVKYIITEKAANLPGELELDFLIYWQSAILLPILVDGPYSHFKTDI